MKLTKDEKRYVKIQSYFADTWRVGWCLYHGVFLAMVLVAVISLITSYVTGRTLAGDILFFLGFLMLITFVMCLVSIMYIVASWYWYVFYFPKKLKPKKKKRKNIIVTKKQRERRIIATWVFIIIVVTVILIFFYLKGSFSR